MKDTLTPENEIFLKGVGYYKSKKFNEAIPIFKKCLEFKNFIPEITVYACLSTCYRVMKDYGTADAILTEGIKKGHDELWNSLAEIKQLKSGKKEDYVKTLLKGAKAGSKSAITCLVSIMSSKEMYSDYKKAIEFADKLIEEKTIPVPANVAVSKAVALNGLGNHDEAIVMLRDLFEKGVGAAGEQLVEIYLEKDSPIFDINKALKSALDLKNNMTVLYLCQIYTYGSSDPERNGLIKVMLEEQFNNGNLVAILNMVYLSLLDNTNVKAIYDTIDYIRNKYRGYTLDYFKQITLNRFARTEEDISKVNSFFFDYGEFSKRRGE